MRAPNRNDEMITWVRLKECVPSVKMEGEWRVLKRWIDNRHHRTGMVLGLESEGLKLFVCRNVTTEAVF